MDLSEACDYISHELLIAKLDSYGVTKNNLKLIINYLNRRKQRTKIGSSDTLFTRVPQASILGPLPFNIFIIMIYFYLSNDSTFVTLQTTTLCMTVIKTFQRYFNI